MRAGDKVEVLMFTVLPGDPSRLHARGKVVRGYPDGGAIDLDEPIVYCGRTVSRLFLLPPAGSLTGGWLDDVTGRKCEVGTICPRCDRTSWNPDDLAQRYCGACHLFYAEA